MRLVVFLLFAAAACSQGVHYWHREAKPDGVYYVIDCNKMLECVSFARQRCPGGYETVENHRHELVVRCN